MTQKLAQGHSFLGNIKLCNVISHILNIGYINDSAKEVDRGLYYAGLTSAAIRYNRLLGDDDEIVDVQ